jgi:hypothetical protein
MDKIRNKLKIADTILPVPYWKVTKSGKVLELRVRPSIDHEPGNYRLGIIQIGQIISHLQKLAKHSGAKPQIQLFPNLAENQLAATVYWPGFLEDVPYDKTQKMNQEQLSIKKIKEIAKHYNLALTADISDVSEGEGQVSSTYVVISKSNQPFVWLKVGQFIQDVMEHLIASGACGSCAIDVLTSFSPETLPSKRMISYKQAKVSLHKSVSSND